MDMEKPRALRKSQSLPGGFNKLCLFLYNIYPCSFLTSESAVHRYLEIPSACDVATIYDNTHVS